MRVICISNKWIPAPGKEKARRPDIGDIDLVIEEEIAEDDGKLYYRLERFGKESWFRSDMFAVLPDEPEEIIEEQETEYASA